MVHYRLRQSRNDSDMAFYISLSCVIFATMLLVSMDITHYYSLYLVVYTCLWCPLLARPGVDVYLLFLPVIILVLWLDVATQSNVGYVTLLYCTHAAISFFPVVGLDKYASILLSLLYIFFGMYCFFL